MKNSTKKIKPAADVVYRKDYAPIDYEITAVEMGFDLGLERTELATRLQVRRKKTRKTSANLGAINTQQQLQEQVQQRSQLHGLVLYGRDVQLNWIAINGVRLPKKAYSLQGEMLILSNLPRQFTLDIATTLYPQANTTLMGLYASQGNCFTQCEAEGFRRMTYFPDRPDVMSVYTVMLRADKAVFPVLLSNGNLTKAGDLPAEIDTKGNALSARHYAVWHDPHPKPSYLFAVVAGKLVVRESEYLRQDGVKAKLQVWVREADLPATAWALQSLQASIDWDKKTFGLDLDLERFMIVAVGDFNMGAMENKGLNVFNTAYVLATPETATDTDYSNIEAVVGHEYFHNWTGNRVTCQDWFQLTLKEGLTVYRDQCFSADMAASGLNKAYAASARAVRRIEDVRVLRAAQFGEDSGAMAHPIRPDQFEDISNFYTATIYEKGAEVIRMMALLAEEKTPKGFRLGMDTYFARHDGQAVTCEDFVRSIEQGAGLNLQQFRRWYSQAGTPTVTASMVLRQNKHSGKPELHLTLSQRNPAVGAETKNAALVNDGKAPLHIPIVMGLLGKDGAALKFNYAGTRAAQHVLHLRRPKQTFVFESISDSAKSSQPAKFGNKDLGQFEHFEHFTPSLLRGFSAPVRLEYAYSTAQLSRLLAHDTDAFNQWEAGQTLAQWAIMAHYEQAHNAAQTTAALVRALTLVLQNEALDLAFKALVFTLPTLDVLSQSVQNLRPDALYEVREAVLNALAQDAELSALWGKTYAAASALLAGKPYETTAEQSGARAWRNVVLGYWLRSEIATQSETRLSWTAAQHQYDTAHNLTDRLGALTALYHHDAAASKKNLTDFYTRYAAHDLVIDKWFALQASRADATVVEIETLMAHPAYSLKTPNRARSVIFRFCLGNMPAFHAADGSGYALWARVLRQLNEINPEIAARLARAMDRWANFAPNLAAQMQLELKGLAAEQNLARSVQEIVKRALGG